MKTMGQRIKQKRTEYGLTMEELGNRLGVQKSAVNKWEKGEVLNIKRSYIKEMADIFHCSPAWLMGMDDVKDVTLTYTAEGKEAVTTTVDLDPIIGHKQQSLRAALYAAALAVKDDNLEVAIELLKSLS